MHSLTLERSKKPFLTRSAFLVCYAAVSSWCCIFYCSIQPSPDQSLFDYIAWQGLHGIQWYTGSFDFTWPGSLAIHEVGIRLFGVHSWTARLTDFIILQPTILAMFFFFEAAGLNLASRGSALVYPIIYVTCGGWMAGHRDIVAMHMLIIASSLVVILSPHSTVKFFLAGAVVGYAVMIRPTYLIFLPFLYLTSLIPSQRSLLLTHLRPAIALLLGTLLFPSIFLVDGFLSGTLDRFLAINRAVFEIYADHSSRGRLLGLFVENIYTYFSWLFVVGIVGALIWISEGTRRKHIAVLLAMAATSIISFAAQNKGFGYHLGGLIPVLVMSALGGANLGCDSLGRSTSARRLSKTAAAAVLVLVSIGTARRIQHNLLPSFASSDPRTTIEGDALATSEAVAIIRRDSEPTSYFFQWGWNYEVGFLSQRLAASQFLNTPALSLITSDDIRYRDWLSTFDKELSDTKPKFILVDLTTLPTQTQISDRGVQFLQELPSPALRILSQHLNEKYFNRRQWKDSVLFQRIATEERLH